MIAKEADKPGESGMIQEDWGGGGLFDEVVGLNVMALQLPVQGAAINAQHARRLGFIPPGPFQDINELIFLTNIGGIGIARC